MRVETVATESLGDRSYVVHDGEQALVIDPQRDIDRIEAVLAASRLRLAMVLETHIHNDYVTGGLALAQSAGVPYVVAAIDRVEFERLAARDGDGYDVGDLTVAVLTTPGHTDGHLSYVVSQPGQPAAVFTGGSLLFGSVGRTDLVAPERTDELSRAQYRTARRLAGVLADETLVYPTHGFGSFCSSGSTSGQSESTIGEEKQRNQALVERDEDRFVSALVGGLTAYPAYYVHMGPRNRTGPAAPDLSAVALLDQAELARRISAGEWVVDLRHRGDFAADHITGTISIGLCPQFATYLGWLFPYGQPLTLVGQSPQQVSDAQRELVRIGLERPSGAAVASLDELAHTDQRGSFPTVGFGALTDLPSDAVLIDVRRPDERAGGEIPGSLHIPLHQLLTSMADVPDASLWVHCASGFRASIAASILARAGRKVVLVDDMYSTAVDLGFAVAA